MHHRGYNYYSAFGHENAKIPKGFAPLSYLGKALGYYLRSEDTMFGVTGAFDTSSWERNYAALAAYCIILYSHGERGHSLW